MGDRRFRGIAGSAASAETMSAPPLSDAPYSRDRRFRGITDGAIPPTTTATASPMRTKPAEATLPRNRGCRYQCRHHRDYVTRAYIGTGANRLGRGAQAGSPTRSLAVRDRVDQCFETRSRWRSPERPNSRLPDLGRMSAIAIRCLWVSSLMIGDLAQPDLALRGR